jgi:hypothetical protein
MRTPRLLASSPSAVTRLPTWMTSSAPSQTGACPSPTQVPTANQAHSPHEESSLTEAVIQIENLTDQSITEASTTDIL